MRKKIGSIIRIVGFASIGIFLFWLVYKDQPMNQIIKALKDANYLYIVISLVLAFISHVSRAMRWNILINSLGYKPKLINTTFAVFIMYLSNSAIPRSGEITRCGIMKKYEKVPFSQLIGTVIVERVADFIMLFILLIIVLFTQLGVILKFIEKNPDTGSTILSLISYKNLIIAILCIIFLIVGFIVFQNKMKNFIIYKKIKEFLINIISGIKTVKNLDKKWQFMFHSVLIWILYFSMVYIVFLSFDFTSHLSILTGLTVFVMASLGMVAPSPAGIGTWHFMVIETLVIYGINKHPDANAFAFAAHGSMTLFAVFLGLLSLFFLPIYNKKKLQIE